MTIVRRPPANLPLRGGHTYKLSCWHLRGIGTQKLKVSGSDAVDTFLAMYDLWVHKTERLDLYKAGEDEDQRRMLLDMLGRTLSLDAALGLLAQLDALCKGVTWSVHAEMVHRLLRCLKITPESRIIFNQYYRMAVSEITANTYEEAVASLRQIHAQFGHPLERSGQRVIIQRATPQQLQQRANARAAGPSGASSPQSAEDRARSEERRRHSPASSVA
jgi:hypothetical protein